MHGKRPKHREVKGLALYHTACSVQSEDSDPGLQTPEPQADCVSSSPPHPERPAFLQARAVSAGRGELRTPTGIATPGPAASWGLSLEPSPGGLLTAAQLGSHVTPCWLPGRLQGLPDLTMGTS